MKIAKFCIALSLVVIHGCGGGGGGSDNAPGNSSAGTTPVGGSPATPTTTLASSATSLALVVKNPAQSGYLSGTPRLISVTNIGSSPALAVTYVPSPALPSGTTVTPADCGDMAPNATCVLTVTPGAAPSAAPADTSPAPVTLTIAGTNTNALGVAVQVLTYGSVYQAGYLFSVDDATPNTGSIGGKVVALTDQSTTVVWSPAGNDNIPGIYETSVAPPAACNGNTDGACNTRVITQFYSAYPSNTYAAGLCSTANIGGFADWYLPAICELGYDASGLASSTRCGAPRTPTLQNMQSNLVDNGNMGGLTIFPRYWSSGEAAAINPNNPAMYAAVQQFDIGGRTFQIANAKSHTTSIFTRCVRALTH